MKPRRVIFMGTPDFAVPSLVALCEASKLTQVVGVVTQPDRPSGRGRKMTASPVKREALSRSIPVISPTRFRAPETLAQLEAWAPDVVVVAAFGRILPQSMLTLAPHGALNVHASLLPRHRGASPIAHAIWQGDETTGISLMQMDAGLDTGAVFVTQSMPIGKDDTLASLTLALAHLGAQMLGQHIGAILSGQLQATPQPTQDVSHAPPLKKEQGEIQWNRPAFQIARQIRALTPWPGTHTYFQGHRIVVLSAREAPLNTSPSPTPGTVVRSDSKGLWVACDNSLLQLVTVKPAGRSAMAAGAWAVGQGPRPGTQLGAGPLPNKP